MNKLIRVVKKFGTGSHIVLPKKAVGKVAEIRILTDEELEERLK